MNLATLGERDGWHCRYCGLPLDATTGTRDHIIPRIRGGTNADENVVLACEPCNSHKGSAHPEDFLASRWLADRRAAMGTGTLLPPAIPHHKPLPSATPLKAGLHCRHRKNAICSNCWHELMDAQRTAPRRPWVGTRPSESPAP